jgi:hypothetical protein
MPILKRKRLSRTGYTDEQKQVLLTGEDLFCDAFPGTHPERDNYNDVIRPAWDDLRAELLPAFIRENPGRRPWAWWQFDAPERRSRCVYESQLAYLRRLSLVTPEEKRLVAKGELVEQDD